MILDLFSLIIFLSLVFVVIGFTFKDWTALSLIGFAVIFILSIVILNTGLEVETGATTSTAYTYNPDGTIATSTQTILYSYSNWSDSNTHTIGYLLSVIGLIGGVFILWSSGLNTRWDSVLKKW
jgi:hypothetical protein